MNFSKSLTLFLVLVQMVCSFFTNHLEKKAPLVISNECETLKRQFSNSKSSILLVDYKMESYTMDNVKLMYHHSSELAKLMQYIRNQETELIINFNFLETLSDVNRFHLESQIFNILRAFVSGMYKVNPLFFPESWKLFEKLEKMTKEKGLKTLFFFSNYKMYQEKLKRFDSYFEKYYDTSRHLITLFDYDIQKNIEYLKSIENPIGIKMTGRVTNKKILHFMSEINHKNEYGKLVLILNCNKLQSKRRQLPLLLNSLSPDEKKNILFCLSINKYTGLEKQIDFFYKISEEYNIKNSGYLLNFSIKNGTIC